MKFSAQEEYGLRCLLAIAREGSLTIPEIGKLEALSQPHVAKLLSILRKAQFIKSSRGQLGGYSLAAPPERIVIGEVLACLGGKLVDQGFCDRHAGLQDLCTHTVKCSVRSLWNRIQRAVDDVVNDVTLRDLMNQEPEQIQESIAAEGLKHPTQSLSEIVQR